MLSRDKESVGAALRYDQEDDLPRIVSAVRGDLVQKLISLAEQNDLPVYRDELLAKLLVNEGEGVYIPDELFPAVAEVLAYCYRIDDDFRKKLDSREVRDQ
ncbi:MAG TPA: EscU/YscU/HrcU family type III secretion system export apparatus switch protein [Spirochaetota bacterium]